MALSKIKYGNSGRIALTINNFTEIGKTVQEITNVIFMFKDKASQRDSEAPMYKELKKGDIAIVDDRMIVTINEADFGTTANKLQEEKTYLVAIGIEFNDTGEFFEDQDDNLSRKMKIIGHKVGI